MLLWLAGLCLGLAVTAVRAQEPGEAPGAAPAQPAPVEASPPINDGASLDPFATSAAAPVLLLTEELDDTLPAAVLRQRLGQALGRDIVSLLDPRARRAHATIWLGMNDKALVLRVTPPQRPEVWRQLPRAELGSDPVGSVVKAVLEMLWADAFARADSQEVQDPFCPPGMICFDPRRSLSWPGRPEVEVLDPWDSSYRRFYTWDPYQANGVYRPPNPWLQPYPDKERERAPTVGQTPAWPSEPAPRNSVRPKPQRFALGLLAGGGVHKGGAFLRYEVNVLRRFSSFDVGLSYVAGRGQTEPFDKVRRAAMALIQRRFVSQDFELDLGASFGIFVADFAGHETEVRPYLRGFLTFALPMGRSFDLLVQSEVGTTFAAVYKTGLVEYALTLGLRHKF